MVEYKYICNENFLVTSILQYRKQIASKPFRVAIKILGGIPLLALFLLPALHRVVFPSVWFGIFLFLLIFSPKIEFWLMKKRLRKPPFYNVETQIAIPSNSWKTWSNLGSKETAWKAFTRARRFGEEFLVFLANKFFIDSLIMP